MAAGQIIDEDAELALQHAIAARRLASRIAVVREAVGLAAYAAGDWTTAIAELRTYHRMTGRQTHLAEIADSERALGRPERAVDLFRGADMEALDKAGAIELLIVAAGARGDLGQHDAAVAMLQVKELTSSDDAEWAARLRYAYADALLAADRRDEAREWFSRAAAVDEDQLTDATERLLELDGITIDDDDEDEDDDLRDTAEGDDEDDLRDAAEGDDDEDEDEDDLRDAAERDEDDEDDADRDAENRAGPPAGEDDDDFDEVEDDDVDDGLDDDLEDDDEDDLEEDEDEPTARVDGLPDDDDDDDLEDDEDDFVDDDVKAKADDAADQEDDEDDLDAEAGADVRSDGDAKAAGK
ncbi:hypothetical protein [Paractinoplanes globisporus]|uniref:Replicase polyprotein 1ab n=1 Tax=Paractinoplanes globisporus TaxID=113565 RepID=A0ABW6WVL3_9ACTN|nr:hypothetical protein [Actinoplanes globisporus]